MYQHVHTQQIINTSPACPAQLSFTTFAPCQSKLLRGSGGCLHAPLLLLFLPSKPKWKVLAPLNPLLLSGFSGLWAMLEAWEAKLTLRRKRRWLCWVWCHLQGSGVEAAPEPIINGLIFRERERLQEITALLIIGIHTRFGYLYVKDEYMREIYVCVCMYVYLSWYVYIHILIYRRMCILALILVSKHRSWLHLVLGSADKWKCSF